MTPPVVPLARALEILLVEDSARDAQLVALYLDEVVQHRRPHLTHVQSLAAALELVTATRFDCILLDLGLPDARSVKSVEALRAADRTAAIVVMTGLDDDRCAIDALRSGAQEYLIKGHFSDKALMRVINYAVERNQVLVSVDKERDRARYFAVHDSLTGLPNRYLLVDRAQMALHQAARRGERFALCFLDLDGFKAINDRHGHLVGDAALQEVSEILAQAVRASDTVARIGGDEFGALLCHSPEGGTVERVMTRVIEGVRALTSVKGREVNLGISVGVAVYPDDGATVEELLANADAAMYAAKRSDKGLRFFVKADSPVANDGAASVAASAPRS
ncbi:MAG TPA: diguanylate cyclase [Solimonas sp.]|nr:diguanylate cyclase [Solimonas sp.]